jgi:hypothetical protein
MERCYRGASLGANQILLFLIHFLASSSVARLRPDCGFDIPASIFLRANSRDSCDPFQPMNEWNIQSRAHVCEACAQPFANRQPYHTLLYDEKADQLRRMDVCDACWRSQFSEGARERKGFVSHWQGIYETPPAHAPDPIQRETAETLLRKLIEENDPRYAPAAFILAVMLERKRLLKVKEQIKRDGRRVFVYEHPKSGDLFTIADPELHLNQLEAVQHDVAQLLEHGLNPPPPGESPAPAAEQTTRAENEPAPAKE